MIANQWCCRCRKHTENKEPEIVRTKNRNLCQRSTCAVCGAGKSRFLPQYKEGGAIADSDSNRLAHFAESAYQPEDARLNWLREKGVGEGFEQDQSLSDKEQAVLVDPQGKEILVSFRGTVPTESSDLVSDLRILLGRFKAGKRYKKSEEVVDKVLDRYQKDGFKVRLVGHSLGARLSHDIAIEKGLESDSFNIGSAPIDARKGFWEALKCKVTPELCAKIHKNGRHYHSVGDPISTSALIGTAKTKFYKPKVSNPHSLDNFKT